jgi:hypothetical protein
MALDRPEPRASARQPALPIVAKPLYLAPAFALLAIFFLLPALATLAISFTDWTLGGKTLALVGVDNYRALLAGDDFRISLANTLKLNLFVIPASFVVALGLALAIHNATRTAALWQTVYFLPVTTSLVAMAFVWQWVLHPEFGVVAFVLNRLGAPPVNWLNDPGLVLYTIGFISLWQLTGYYMVLFLAGLLSIPRALYEARPLPARHLADARSDRPVRLHRDRHQVVPDLRRRARIDQGRAEQSQRDHPAHALPGGVRVLPHRSRRGDRDPVLPGNARPHPLADAHPRPARALRVMTTCDCARSWAI